MIGRLLGALLVAGVVATAGACTPEDQETRTLDPQGEQTRAQLPPELVEALDSGSTAYREDRYEDALAHYERAAEMAPDQPAGWFGVSMAERALGDTAAADSALERVRELAPGATMVHDEDAEGAAEGGGP